jgi:heme exporter protein C
MEGRRGALTRAAWTPLWVLVGGLAIGSVVMVVWCTPVDPAMGAVRKVLYLHLPAAIDMFLGCGAVFVCGVGFIWQRREVWDRAARAAAEATALLSGVVLVTGMVWAHKVWGAWWVWSPRLTFSLVLWVVTVVYLVVRGGVRPAASRRALAASVYAVVAFLNLPLFYLWVRLLEDAHVAAAPMEPAVVRALWVCSGAVTVGVVGLALGRFARLKQRAPPEGRV